MIRYLGCWLLLLPLMAHGLQFGPDNERQGALLDKAVAVVNGDVITYREWRNAKQVVRQRLQRLPSSAKVDLDQEALEYLIMMRLQKRLAQQNGITINDEDLRQAMISLAKQRKLSLRQFQQQEAAKTPGGLSAYRDQVRDELLISQLRQRVVASEVQISEQQIDQMQTIAQRMQSDDRRYRVGQILIAVEPNGDEAQWQQARRQAEKILRELQGGDSFLTKALLVSDNPEAADLGWRRRDELPSLFVDAVTGMSKGGLANPIRSRNGYHLLTLLDVQGQKKTDQALPAIAQTQVRHILIKAESEQALEAAKSQINRLHKRLLAGGDFAELAKAYSDDTVSAARGGALGWVNPRQMVPEFEDVMQKSSQGVISQPFQSLFGWHILQVTDRRNHRDPQLQKRALWRARLFEQQAQETWLQFLNEIRQQAYVEIIDPRLKQSNS